MNPIELILFVMGRGPRSSAAIGVVHDFMQKGLKQDIHIKIIDASKDVEMLEKFNVISIPTLVKSTPPKNRFSGNITEQALLYVAGLEKFPQAKQQKNIIHVDLSASRQPRNAPQHAPTIREVKVARRRSRKR